MREKKPQVAKRPTKKPIANPEFRSVFPADVTAKVLARLTAVGDGARLMVRDDGTNSFIRVLFPEGTVAPLKAALGDDDPGEFNNAHRCPPFLDCPT